MFALEQAPKSAFADGEGFERLAAIGGVESFLDGAAGSEFGQ